MKNRNLQFKYDRKKLYSCTFFAMGSPCEFIIATEDHELAKSLGTIVSTEAWRIEDKYSRYIDGNIISKLNASNGQWLTIDTETKRLIDFAKQCYELSEGLFDITSGSLRTIWDFKSKDIRIPSESEIAQALKNIGFNKIIFRDNSIKLLPEMEIDLGGIGKEYAVDMCTQKVAQQTNSPFLINFGGDLFANKPIDDKPWSVGLENPQNSSEAIQMVDLYQGAIATSGVMKRNIKLNNKIYGHILNPKTAWPILNPPQAVSVHASSCTDAGILSTLAMLHGEKAEEFLALQPNKHWCYR